NDGDVEAWPVWTITGPATSIELENVTTGKKIELSSTLSAGQKRIITTKPGISTVLDENGDNKWSELSDTSALWALEPGLNELVLTVGNSDADTVVEMTYHPGTRASDVVRAALHGGRGRQQRYTPWQGGRHHR